MKSCYSISLPCSSSGSYQNFPLAQILALEKSALTIQFKYIKCISPVPMHSDGCHLITPCNPAFFFPFSAAKMMTLLDSKPVYSLPTAVK